MTRTSLGDDEYRELLARRDELRRFLRWSEQEAKRAGLTDAQHQLLLAIRGHEDAEGPSIGDVADHLLLRHHSAVELVQRAELAGLLTRRTDADDRRLVRLSLSPAGEAALDSLGALHAEELRRLATEPSRLSAGIEARDGRLEQVAPAEADGRSAGEGPGHPQRRRPRGAPGTPEKAETPETPVTPAAPPAAEPAGPSPAPAAARPPAVEVRVRRVAERAAPDDGRRVLVDRAWPAGIRADDAPFDEWLGSVAPSSELRRALGPDGGFSEELAARYGQELAAQHGSELDRLVALAREAPLVLVTATSDPDRSAAAVLAEVLRSRPAPPVAAS